MPPSEGVLWTPGYWGFYGGYYGWHGGYWGESVGYYGGVNYGFGYYGSGFYGGRWEGWSFPFRIAVWRVGGNIHNTYVNREGIHGSGGGHASFNGRGGVQYKPAAREEAAMHANHIQASKEQQGHEQAMHSQQGQFARTNNGKPAVHSMSAPGGQGFNQRGRPAPAGGGGQRVGGGQPRGGGGGGHGGGGKR